jgi:hypothetical protein
VDKRASWVTLFATLLCAAIAIGPAAALTITFNDLGDAIMGTSDDPTIIFTPSVPESVTATARFGFPNSQLVYLIEPGAVAIDGLLPFSDFITAVGGGLQFTSDTAEVLGTVNCNLPSVACIQETGGPQDVFALLYPSGGGGLQIIVESDVEAVPEPATLVLFSTALFGLGFLRLRNRAA